MIVHIVRAAAPGDSYSRIITATLDFSEANKLVEDFNASHDFYDEFYEVQSVPLKGMPDIRFLILKARLRVSGRQLRKIWKSLK